MDGKLSIINEMSQTIWTAGFIDCTFPLNTCIVNEAADRSKKYYCTKSGDILQAHCDGNQCRDHCLYQATDGIPHVCCMDPHPDSYGIKLQFRDDGNLVLLNNKNEIVWQILRPL